MNAGVDSARDCARQIAAAFAAYNAEFRAVTRRAPQRFEDRDWQNSQKDAVERIDLYDRFVDQTIAALQPRLGERVHDRELWMVVRQQFAAQIDGLPDNEFTKTFFSSITRRLFGTVGVAPEIEFVATELDPLANLNTEVDTRSYANRGSLRLLVEDLLGDLRFRSPWRDFDSSVAHVSLDIEAHLGSHAERRAVEKIEVMRPIFYQFTRAYVVGRITGRNFVRPLVLALKNDPQGLVVDAVVLTEDDVSVVFGYTRSYFHVDLERVGEAVQFLSRLLPRKPISELFTVLGRAKQGKTERYRAIIKHLGKSEDLFLHAPGERGDRKSVV